MNNEELEEELKDLMIETTNTLERNIKDAPTELQKNSISIDLVKDAIKATIERYQKSYINLTKKMNGVYKDKDTAELANKIEKQIKELQNLYDIELEGEQLEEFIKPINLSRDNADIYTEETRTEPEKELMDFMDESLHSFESLLNLNDIDSDMREINKNATTQSIEIYKTKYEELLEKVQGTSINPNIMLKQSQIENMIERLESRYSNRESQIDILTQMQNNSSDSKDNPEEEIEAINHRKDQEEHLISFLNETLHSFNALLQLEDIDSDTRDINKEAVIQSIGIYRKKYEELLQQMGGFSQNPNSLLRQSQIEQMIKSLELKYADRQPQMNILEEMQEGNDVYINEYGEIIRGIGKVQDISQREKINQQGESIKDEVGDEFNPQTEQEKQEEQQVEMMWQNKFQAWDRDAVNLPNSAKRKEEAVKVIQDIERQKAQQKKQEIQEEQENNMNR